MNERAEMIESSAGAAILPPHSMAAASMLPRATMRVQLHKDFNFAQARAVVPYLAALGISHLYTSPILTARPGSKHGYDIVDHGAVNPELGGEDGLRALVAELRAHGMALLVDIVPNHMAVGGAANRSWLDVLEWGPLSRYANFFDIDWDVADPDLTRRVLVPLLGKPYGEALAAGEIELCFDARSGRFYCRYFEHRLPLAPASYVSILNEAAKLDSAEKFGGGFAEYAATLRAALAKHRGARGAVFDEASHAFARAIAGDRQLRAALKNVLAVYNAGNAAAAARLHRLLERQHYRLAWWRTAADQINWRRFFDVIELAGIRAQETAVFEISHATIFRLYAEGLIDGLRIDHIDGLADPRTYCRRLRSRLARLNRQRPASAPRGRPYVVVEKILGANEPLVREWQVQGTTGYSFMNSVGALLHAPQGEQPLTQLWSSLTGRSGDFDSEEKRARRRIPLELLEADFNACAHALHNIARRDPATRDWTVAAIRRVLLELLVQFPVYRTYADARGRSAADNEIMAQTIAAAATFCRPSEQPLLTLIDRWLGGEPPLQVQSTRERRLRLRAIARFQQLSSPVAAKSVEDTAFYRHGRLLSRNEVGANPSVFSIGAEEFHRECVNRAQNFPYALLATATHDHKRGEDVRARLAVLSECAPAWSIAVSAWREQNAAFKTPLPDGSAGGGNIVGPDAADEYMLYQMLVGAWPLQLSPGDGAGIGELGERLAAWLQKALREAKRYTSWAQPNEAYENACANFLQAVLDPQRAPNFICSLDRFVQRIAAAGALNGLAQTVLKLCAPGVPDIYQGCEYWDFSLVDPDNRRPVDFARRAATLNEDASLGQLLSSWRDGRIKQRIIQRLLALRARAPNLFTEGAYIPLEAPASESGAAQMLAFARRQHGHALVVAVPRFCSALLVDKNRAVTESWAVKGDKAWLEKNAGIGKEARPAEEAWREQARSGEELLQIDCTELPPLIVPRDLRSGVWLNVLEDPPLSGANRINKLPVCAAELFGRLPVAVWYRN